MQLKVNNKIPQPTKVMFGSLMEGEIFIDKEGDICMVTEEVSTSDLGRNDLVNCVVLSGRGSGIMATMDSKDIVTIVKAELNILNYE